MSLIPNSWQTPNDFMDKYNPLLTSEEWRVLSFACRHIFGWHDKIDSRMRRMSLSFFEKGFSIYPGCGLGRAAIVRALDGLSKYGLMQKVGAPTAEGQMWKLPLYESEINLAGLEARQAEKATKAVRQTNHARIKKTGGLSNELVVSQTDRGQSVEQTIMQGAGGLLDRQNQSHLIQSQESKPKDSPTPSGAGSDTPVTETPATTSTQPQAAMFADMTEGQKIGAIIQAYIKGNNILVPQTPRIGKNGKPVTSGNPYANSTNRNNALTLIENGITDQDLTDFIEEKRLDDFWEGKEISWSHILKNIGIWKDANEAISTPSSNYDIGDEPVGTSPRTIPPEEVYTPTPEEMERFKAAYDQIGKGGHK